MGKRGPAAKGEYGDKSAVLSTRISAELRTALEKSVTESGLTLSREIERRLRRTFVDDEKISEGFGTRRNRAFMHMAAMLTQTLHRKDKPEAEWLDDPWLFDQYVIRLNALLELHRPPGEASPPVLGDKILDDEEAHRAIARSSAAMLVLAVRGADASLPTGSGVRSKFDLLKADLGLAATRSEIFVGNADGFREAAQKLAPIKAPRKRSNRK